MNTFISTGQVSRCTTILKRCRRYEIKTKLKQVFKDGANVKMKRVTQSMRCEEEAVAPDRPKRKSKLIHTVNLLPSMRFKTFLKL